jgi:phenylalanyl-tRNA synthetase beta chain
LSEDLAIAWGYDRYPRGLPRRATFGEPLAANEFAETLRSLLIGYGFQEVMSLSFAAAKEAVQTPPRAEVQNPIGEEFSTLRSSLLPGLLNIFRLNKHRELPQRIFENADVVLDAENVPRIAGATMHPKAAFTEGKSLVLSLLRDVGRSGDVAGADDANFIPGRVASVLIGGKEVGRFGEIHPRILEAYTLVQPVVAFELDVTPLRVARE